MKFLVVAIAQCSSGGLSILRDFYDYVSQYSSDKWEFWLSDNYIEETQNVHVRVFKDVKKNRLNRLVFDLLKGRKYVAEDTDAIFNLHNNLIYGLKCPQTVYMDQPIPFQGVKKFSVLKKEERGLAAYQYFFKLLMKDACKKADNIIVQTEWIRNAIIKQCGTKADAIHLVAPSISIPEYIINETLPFNETQFFYPATDLLYKNHEAVILAANILKSENIEFHVVFTVDENENQKSDDNITYGGVVSRDEVYNRLKNSTLVFPSYIESYGMPLAEARALGTIILAADTEFSRELLSGYVNAYFFKYDKPEELAVLMKKVIEKDIIKKNVKKNKKEKNNSWSNVVNILENSVKKKNQL